MDFSRVELSDEDEAFLHESRDFLRELVTDEVLRRDRETGDNFDEGVHLALGEAGYLTREWKPESEGGFNRVRNRIWQLEKRRAHVPWVTFGTTAMIARSVEKFGSPELKAEVMPRVFNGQVRLCLGYTEPEGGSDVATCKTRAVRDGDSWVINGSKMFTTGAHNCQYVFLITNTDPDAPKHKSLTMFLVPLDSPGIEIQGIRTVDGDRTNIVYYSDVRVDDKYRLGEVNDGWTVVREPLNVEHGAVEAAADGLADVSIMMHQAGFMATAADKAAAKVAEDRSRRPQAHRRRLGGISAGPQHRSDGGVAFGDEHLRAGGARADDARHLTGPDGHPRHRRVVAGRNRRCRRRRCRRIRLPIRTARRHLRRDARSVPQHDRPVCARPR